jgi:NADH:ubiquinone oxidoreductase subunit 2 (subunit N)
MSAPLLFIMLPFIFGVAALAVSRWEQPLAVAATSLSAVLALAAWTLPIGTPFSFGPWSPQINPAMGIAGTEMRLGNGFRGILALTYGGGFLWFLGAQIIREQSKIVLLGLVLISLLLSPLAVPGLILASVLIFFSILSGAILLTISVTGDRHVSGVLGFLTFGALAIPFLLMAGGLIPGLGGSPAALEIVVRPSIFLGLGFAFLLAIFPFYAWLPRLAESNRPFRVALVVLFMNMTVSVLAILLVDRIVWLRDSERLYAVLRFTGLLVILTGGFWSAFQRNWSRQMGFAMLVENGLVLVALGSGLTAGLPLIAALLLVRIPAYLVWASGMSVFEARCGSLALDALEGAGIRNPVLGAATLAGHFSAAGLPLLAGFVPRLSLIFTLGSAPEAVGVWAAVLGLAAGGLRTLSILFLRPPRGDKSEEKQADDPLLLRFQQGFLGFVALLLFGFGVFPQIYADIVTRFPLIFSQFAR